MTREDAKKFLIASFVTGSHSYGLNSPTSDVDRKGIIIEPIERLCGLGQPWDGAVYNQAGAGDDYELYGMRKFIRLALKGNPTVTELLFLKPEWADARGFKVQELAPLIISRQAGKAYLGYIQAQRMRMTGERGNGGHGKPRRDEISERVGFDTKFAMHMLRLGFQGIELLSTGKLTLPLVEEKDFLLAVRRGEVDFQSCLSTCGELEAELKELLSTSPIQPEPQTDAVEAYMLKLYWLTWSAQRSVADHLDGERLLEALWSPGMGMRK